MEISKDFGDKRLTVYQPDEKEREKLCKISDEIIDLIESHNLNDAQQIHLVSSLYESMKEMFDVDAMKHMGDSL
jgi:hypothetical protein